jgi:hypothetical protein
MEPGGVFRARRFSFVAELPSSSGPMAAETAIKSSQQTEKKTKGSLIRSRQTDVRRLAMSGSAMFGSVSAEAMYYL